MFASEKENHKARGSPVKLYQLIRSRVECMRGYFSSVSRSENESLFCGQCHPERFADSVWEWLLGTIPLTAAIKIADGFCDWEMNRTNHIYDENSIFRRKLKIDFLLLLVVLSYLLPLRLSVCVFCPPFISEPEFTCQTLAGISSAPRHSAVGQRVASQQP